METAKKFHWSFNTSQVEFSFRSHLFNFSPTSIKSYYRAKRYVTETDVEIQQHQDHCDSPESHFQKPKNYGKPGITKMHCSGVFLAFHFVTVLSRSEAFVVPNWEGTVIGNYPSLNFAQDNQRRHSWLKNQLKNEGYDSLPQSSQVQRRLETTLAPAIDFIDNASDGWALSYADLTPNRYVSPYFINSITISCILLTTGTVKELFQAKLSSQRT